MFDSLGLSTDEAYRRILDAMSHIVWVTDVEGQTLYTPWRDTQNVAGWVAEVARRRRTATL